MAKNTRKCKVCGCEYEYCKTNRRTNAFRYQDVACCPEHGSIYLANIRISRGLDVSRQADTEENKIKLSFDEEIDEDFDPLFEDDFEEESSTDADDEIEIELE